MTIFPSNCLFSAERRAQLSRSRSRQNLFQASAGPDVVREINFDDTTAPGSAEKTTKTRARNNKGGGGKGVGSMSEAEELLKRLQEL